MKLDGKDIICVYKFVFYDSSVFKLVIRITSAISVYENFLKN